MKLNRKQRRALERQKASGHEKTEGLGAVKKTENTVSKSGKPLSKIKKFYEKNYKALMYIPFILLFLAIVQIGAQTAITGDFLNKGVSLKGGVSVNVFDTDSDFEKLEKNLQSSFPNNEIGIRTLGAGGDAGFIIEADFVAQSAELEAFLNKLSSEVGQERSEFNVELTGSSLGGSFFKQTIKALIVSFLFMAIVVFYYFRNPVTSGAVILAALSDIVITLAIANVLGIKLSTAGIAAFLMLIGYSVDTDILLSTKMLKDHPEEHMYGLYSAMKTGLLMTGTTMAAVFVGLLISQSEVLSQILTIVFIGLVVDLFVTWFQNAGLLRWYVEEKRKKAK